MDSSKGSLTHVTTLLRALRWTLLSLILLYVLIPNDTTAETAPSITSSGLNTTVIHHENIYTISGGTRPGSGQNVYYSFGDFSLTATETARFSNTTPHLTTENLLGRVTGGNISSIYGTIDTTSFPGANLFLLNPTGIVFGPTAQLNVGGSVVFTTADYLRFNDGSLFHSVPDVTRDSLLSTAPITAFGFLSSGTANLSGINIKGSSLSVPEGQSIVLVGENLNIQGKLRGQTLQHAKLMAPGGTIQLTSVAAHSDSEVAYPDVTTVTNVNGTRGDHAAISLRNGSVVDFTHNNAGRVSIRGGNLTLEIQNSLLDSGGVGTPANTMNHIVLREDSAITATNSTDPRTTKIRTAGLELYDGARIEAVNESTIVGAIEIEASDHVLIKGVSSDGIVSTIGTIASGDGVGNTIKLDAHTAAIRLEDNGTIETRTFGNKSAGDISLTVDKLVTTSGGYVTTSGNDAASSGNIDITAKTVELLTQPDLDYGGIQNLNEAEAGTGVITIKTNNFRMVNGARLVNRSSGSTEHSANPKLSVHATESIQLSHDSAIRVESFSSDVGTLHIKSQSLSLANLSTISTETFSEGNGGALIIDANNVALSGGSRLTTSSSQGIGHAGDITLRNIRNLTLTGFGTDSQGHNVPTGIFSSTTAAAPNLGAIGQGGQINVFANSITLNDHAKIDTSTNQFALGAGGDILLTANQSVTVSNNAAISSGSTGPGNAGNILIKANNVAVTSGGKITAESTGTGNAGTVTIQGLHSPANSFLLDGVGSSILTSTKGTGTGGDISITAKDVWLRNGGEISAKTTGSTTSATGGTIHIDGSQVRIEKGALVTASTTGAAKGGTIAINAAQTFENSGGIIETTATQAQAGDIAITAGQSVTLTNRAITSTRSAGSGNAGSIFVKAGQQFDMKDSQLTATADHASGGNIDIRATDLIRFTNSLISSSVQGGPGTAGGNISIDPKVVILQNSQVLAQAARGNGGNITITTPLFLADQFSQVDASSRFGLNGTVTIQSPISNLSGTVGQLVSKPSQAHVLLQSQCAALANGLQSSFIVAGRQALSTEPGGWLGSSVLMAMGTSTSPELTAERPGTGPSLASGSETLSLRRLTPAGFLVRSFAVDGSTGCRS